MDTLLRKIIHIDMDAFYASVEQRDNPALRGKPVAVGGNPKNRGVVASASYEARRFGVRSAMSCSQAARVCPNLIFIRPNFEKYVAVSREIRALFETITPLVEPLALDEAYLDVTENKLQEPYAKNLAIYIRNKIYRDLKLTASAGVGPNKFVAKLASDAGKPNGLIVIRPEQVDRFIENLPVEKFWGVGAVTAKKLKAAGISNTGDIRKSSVAELHKIVGSYAQFLFDLAHGQDEREVDPNTDPKSSGTEITFDYDVTNVNRLLQTIEDQSLEISTELRKMARSCRTISVKIKYSDFKLITRSHTLPHPIDDPKSILQTASDLLFRDTEAGSRPIRLLGISVHNLINVNEEVPLQFWFDFGLTGGSNSNKLN